MNKKPNERTTISRQDGENPTFAVIRPRKSRVQDYTAGAGAPGWKPGPNNREVANEMVQVPDQEGKPPKPATESSEDAPKTRV